MKNDKRIKIGVTTLGTVNEMLAFTDGKHIDEVSSIAIGFPIAMAQQIGWDCDQYCRMVRLNWAAITSTFTTIDIDPPK